MPAWAAETLETPSANGTDPAPANRVAWCTQGAKYGARQIPPGALQGVTFVKTPHYVQGAPPTPHIPRRSAHACFSSDRIH